MQHPKYMLTKLGASVSPSGASGSPLTIVKIFSKFTPINK